MRGGIHPESYHTSLPLRETIQMMLERTEYFPEEVVPELVALLYAAISHEASRRELRELGETVTVLARQVAQHVEGGEIDQEYRARIALQIVRHALLQYDVTLDNVEDISGYVSSSPTTTLLRDRKHQEMLGMLSVSRSLYDICRNVLADNARLPGSQEFRSDLALIAQQNLETAGDRLDTWQTIADNVRTTASELASQRDRLVAGVMTHVIEDGITLAAKLQQS